ncbi:hypothetical protein PVMG_00013 [Plasmodium vivax Mauritania I]|uniref:PIR Superfamily Protein n=1 Tax=Plasmodium vivax Mauritania I TaxID=1035515 RepID=A0A0J9T7R4_PLAVI|nr:hypothetical protein PVMG_00013 [Plasmodium vivax Mauritania I]
MHKKLKDLYELYDDFNKFKDEPLVDTKETCQYGKKCVENYKKHVKDCKENYKNGLCMNLIYFKNEYDNHRTHVKSCWNDMSYLDPIKTDMSFSIFTFTQLGSWLHHRSPGEKRKMNKLDMNMQGSQDNSEIEIWRYEIPYHSSYS